MTFFEPSIPLKEKIVSQHPWEKSIKGAYAKTYKYGHTTAKNSVYPPLKEEKVPSKERIKFTVYGNRIRKEFIYCVDLVKQLHKYRRKNFDAPVIQAVAGVEWPKIWNDLKIKYGGAAYCLLTQVAVVVNDRFLGGEKELQEFVKAKYIYYLRPDYYSEAANLFSDYIKSSGRPCVYFQIVIDDVEIGTLVFMLYSDIAPRTCENFIRLCKERKGGYSGTPIHRIVKDSWIQCGGFGLKDTGLDCENFIVPHDKRGVLGMANDGRHVDCSTQFFILLQPQEWMAHKYVAFGQLIHGAETFKKIEAVPVLYESPTQKIIMHKAGILNIECQDIMINRGANKYIDGHIDNLVTIGEWLYEALLEKVFLEAEYRSLQRVEKEPEVTTQVVATNLRETKRFMRNKEEIDKQLKKSQGDKQLKKSQEDKQLKENQEDKKLKKSQEDNKQLKKSQEDKKLKKSQDDKQLKKRQGDRNDKAIPAVDKSENNDFDVEEYEFNPDEYTRNPDSVSESIVVPEKPFHIPLTDVPYVGEVDSVFDIKKLLKGDYCLECDLDKKLGKRNKLEEQSMPLQPNILNTLFGQSSTSSETQSSLDSEDEREIRKYLKNNSDEVSFAGGVIKKVARSGQYKDQKGCDLITDEILRKYRIAEEKEHMMQETFVKKSDLKVTISLASAVEAHKKKVKRRQTGFVRPEDLARIRKFEGDDEDEEDDDDDELAAYQPYTRQVALSRHAEPASDETKKKEIRQTGFVRKSEFEKLHIFTKKDSVKHLEDAVDDYRDRYRSRGQGLQSRSMQDDVDIFFDAERPSILTRLYEDVANDDSDTGPTLKEYKPSTETDENKHIFLTFSPSKSLKYVVDVRDKYKRHKLSIDTARKPIDHVLFLQHGKEVYRKISSDYVRTIDRIEQKEEKSIRSIEYAKKRPTISVKDYQRKNFAHNESQSNLQFQQSHTVTKTSKMNQHENDAWNEDDQVVTNKNGESDAALENATPSKSDDFIYFFYPVTRTGGG